MMRQYGKQILTLTRLAGFLIMALLPWRAALGADAVIQGLIATDPLTGVALEGYDPVSYFTQNEPGIGAPQFEYVWSGVPFYFVSAANRDVFVAHPDVYAPLFGGYGVMGVARGFLAAGNPRIYKVMAGRLFLFYSTGNREAFLAAPRSAYDKAAANWPKLSQTLVHDSGAPAVPAETPAKDGGADAAPAAGGQ